MKQPFLIHNHTEFSNFRLKDSINPVEKLLDEAVELGLDGLCITDHEALSGHIRAYKHITKNPDKFKDFVLGYGNEVYLVDRKEVESKKENNERISFYHFILLAKDKKGYEGLRKLSTKAWSNHFVYRGMERVPLFYDELEEVMQEYKGHIIGSTACVGGFLPQSLLTSIGYSEYDNQVITPQEQSKAKQDVVDFLNFMVTMFGDDFYIELQPGDREIQLLANKLLYSLAKQSGIKPIITTDTHYMNIELRELHKAYLNSQQGSREVDEFYSTTYLMNREYLSKHFFADDLEILDELINNTREIRDKIVAFDFGRETQVTKAIIPSKIPETTIFNPYLDDHPYIKQMIESEYLEDKYYMYLLEEGFNRLKEPINDTTINRIELEVKQLCLLTEHFKKPMSGYFLAAKDFVDLIWKISIVAPGRGSAACYYTNYLLGIVQVNPLKHNLPYWRFLHIARGKEMPDELLVWNVA